MKAKNLDVQVVSKRVSLNETQKVIEYTKKRKQVS